jgi:hypothetical protein
VQHKLHRPLCKDGQEMCFGSLGTKNNATMGATVTGADTETPQARARSLSFCGFRSFSFGFRPCFLPSRPYFRVCVSVACFCRQKPPCKGVKRTSASNNKTQCPLTSARRIEFQRTRCQNIQHPYKGKRARPDHTSNTTRNKISKTPNLSQHRQVQCRFDM